MANISQVGGNQGFNTIDFNPNAKKNPEAEIGKIQSEPDSIFGEKETPKTKGESKIDKLPGGGEIEDALKNIHNGTIEDGIKSIGESKIDKLPERKIEDALKNADNGMIKDALKHLGNGIEDAIKATMLENGNNDGEVGPLEANVYANGEYEIQSQIDKKMQDYDMKMVQRHSTDGSDPRAEYKAKVEKEIRDNYSKNNPDYASAQADCQKAEAGFETYKKEQEQTWAKEHPMPAPTDHTLQDNGRFEKEMEAYKAEYTEFLVNITADYAENNPDFENIMNAKAQVAENHENEGESVRVPDRMQKAPKELPEGITYA